MKVTICTLGIGGWYPEGAARLMAGLTHIYEAGFYPSPVIAQGYTACMQLGNGLNAKAFIDKLPPGAPANVIEDGYDYTAYCAKPFVLLDAMKSGADIAIWIDAAFVPIRRLDPLIEHIAEHGYYLCKNGAWVGEWASDRCLEEMRMSREEAMGIQEVSSYCVGLRLRGKDGPWIPHCAKWLIDSWCEYAADRLSIPGPHANVNAVPRVDPQRGLRGFVSADPRVKGHRHDQTVLSILAHRLGFHELTERPKFTSYQGYSTEETVLEHRGM